MELTDPTGLDALSDWTNNALGFGAGLLNGLTMGLSSAVLGAVVPGYKCLIQNNVGYNVGDVTGTVMNLIIVGALTAGAGDVAEGALELARLAAEGPADAVAEAAEDGLSRAADDGASSVGDSAASHADAPGSVESDAPSESGPSDEGSSDEGSDSCGPLAGGESFTAATGVVLASGAVVPISDVRAGEKVRAVDTKTGKAVTRTVEAVWVKRDTDLMDVTVTGPWGVSSVVHTTAHHLFWDVTAGAWVEADGLHRGDLLRADDGSTVTFAGATVVPGAAPMWDITVAGVHDFYVSTATSTVLVHNISCSAKLGKNLEDSGTVRPAETDAHHMVATGSRNAVDARAVLDKFGIDINSEENGVFLPSNLRSANPLGAAVHSTLHTLDYYGRVNALLGSAQSSEDVVSTLSLIRGQLLGGGLY